jgi:Na+-translocating ferredoxin:NAD+ oxidoreductase RnfA subunit
MNLISLFITSIFSENIILSKVLGINSSFQDLKDRGKAFKIGVLFTIIVTIASTLSYFLYHYVLEPNNIEYLKIICFITIITFISIVCLALIKLISTSLYETLNSYILFIILNSGVFGIILLSIQNEYKLPEVLIYSLGSGTGYLLVTYIFSTINGRLGRAPIIRGFKGLPIMLITLFIISLIFTRYIGG